MEHSIPQPKNLNDPLYRLVDEFLIPGDQLEIAEEVKVTESAVSRVKRGLTRSSRIWNRLVETALARKNQKDEVTKYLNS